MFKSNKSIGGSNGPWCNQMTSTNESVVCEICGTKHLKRDESEQSYYLAVFLGKQVVLECCGKIFDVLYAESGEKFAMKFLEDFADEPTGIRFGLFVIILKACLKRAKEVLLQRSTEVAEVQEALICLK